MMRGEIVFFLFLSCNCLKSFVQLLYPESNLTRSSMLITDETVFNRDFCELCINKKDSICPVNMTLQIGSIGPDKDSNLIITKATIIGCEQFQLRR